MWPSLFESAALLLSCGALVQSQTTTSACSTSPVSSQVAAPSVASGYTAKLVATGLRKPRGIAFDSSGHLLVVEQNHGVTALTIDDLGGDCVSVSGTSLVINDTNLNHGIAFNHDGSTLFVSSPDSAYSYPYSASSATISGPVPGTLLVANMSGSDHTTRTLLYSNFSDATLVITRGSTANIDPETLDISSGHSQIKSFNLSDPSASSNASFDSAGTLLGWGLRNDVGIAEHPTTGGLWSVENSVDQLNRSGIDIHANNPAEELNFLGYLNMTSIPSAAYLADDHNQGSNYGYPQCFAAWNAEDVPDYAGLKTGQQFAIGGQEYDANDTYCAEQVTAPRLVFEAHMAPLDIKFNPTGSEAWVSFHGSWNRDDPAGYKVSAVPFDPATGQPMAASDSMTGYIDIVSNADLNDCPTHCFRPVGLAFDAAGRLWFSSDSTGEVYVITRDGTPDGSVDGPLPSITPSSTPSSTGTPTGSANMGASSTAAAVSLMMPGSEGTGRSGLAVWAVSIGAIIAARLLM